MNNLDEYIKNYKSYLNDGDLSDNSIEAYILDARLFLNYLNDKKIDIERLTNSYILSYVYTIQKNNKKSTTINRKLSSLKKFITYLKEILKIDFDFEWNYKSIEMQTSFEFLTEKEFNNFVMNINGLTNTAIRDRAIIELFAATGIKCQELIDLRPTDVNILFKSISIINGDNSRTLALNNRCIFYLNEYLKINNDTFRNNFFTTTHNTPLTRQSIHKIFNKYSKLSNMDIDITAQVLRDSMAKWLVDNGIDAYSLQKILGINDIKSIEKYYNILSNIDYNEKLIKLHPLK